MDLKKTYDPINRYGMRQMLRSMELEEQCLKQCRVLCRYRARDRVGMDVSECFRLMRQGRVMSLLLFNVYMDGAVG